MISSPRNSETPHVQAVTLKGELKECGGPGPIESGTFVAHMKTTEEVSCSALSSLASEPTTTGVSLLVKWLKEGPASHGSLAFRSAKPPLFRSKAQSKAVRSA